MKKYLKVLIVTFITITLFVGCGKNIKDPTQNRVDGSTFTINSKEFKNYYNDSIGFSDTKIDNFQSLKYDSSNDYSSIECMGNFTIIADSDTENGKLTSISISYKGGTEGESTNFTKNFQYNKNDIEKLKKASSKIFDICETKIPTEDFNDFFDKCFRTLLTLTSVDLGDVTVTFNPLSNLSFEFKPKGAN